MIVYQAQHLPIERLDPRPVKTYNSVGTWFTSSAEHARLLYGPNVYSFELPAGRYLEAHSDNFDEFFLNWPLAQETLNRRDFTHLKKHPPTSIRPAEYPELGNFLTTRRIMRDLLLNPDYMRKFRDILEKANYDGVVWKDSRIDLRPGDVPHDVYLLFQKEPLYPIDNVVYE
jgi:hypothetical protein